MTQPEHLSTRQILENSEDISATMDSHSRVELLERNLRYIQEQHQITLSDLHEEIKRLQEENKDLHYRLIHTQSDRATNPIPSPATYVLENQHHLEEDLTKLEKQLFESNEKNRSLLRQIEELNKITPTKSSEEDDNQSSTRTDHNEYQHLLTVLYEKQQQYLQEIAKLRSVSLEILNTERLSLASKVLLRDCLTSSNIPEISMGKPVTTPVDMLLTNEKANASPSLTGKTCSFRHELPIRRLNLSPPKIMMQRANNEQRVHLPNITQRNNSTLSHHSADINGTSNYSMSSSDYSQYQCLLKVGETPIARRERRTQELQKNRLMKNLFH